jgi:hypothetical protein
MYVFNFIKYIKVFFPHPISNVSENCKVLNSNILWCERYKKEKLFVRKKSTSTDLDAPMNNSYRAIEEQLRGCSENPLSNPSKYHCY